MMQSGTKVRSAGAKMRLGGLALAMSGLLIAGCAKKEDSADTADTTPAAATTTQAADAAAAPAAAPAAAAVAADNTDTVSGVKLASYTGDAAAGKTDFAICMTCHAIEAGVNKIGPSLHGVVGRKAGSIAGFTYSAANKNSGITWSPEKLFQYLEGPQRVVPGTKMSYAGLTDPQKRADVIAYLKTQS
ncbi:cytochrome c family protein [Novosphingobium sp.]|uniref:c-type cytochrome n=1 Tax=Novosphingobium sp. TaxID=1874826 RepID=UPI0025CD0082|nr:cytochrome c family protein [Novosphingobium sp.]